VLCFAGNAMTQQVRSKAAKLPQRVALTDQLIGNFPAVTVGRVGVRDALTSQLELLIGPKSRSWYVRVTMHRTTHRVRIGPWPIVGVDEARGECLEVLRRLYKGEPTKARTPTTAPTLSTVLSEYLEARKLSRQAGADIRSIINKHAADWGTKPVDHLDVKAVAARYRDIAKTKPAQANRLLGSLGALTRYSQAAHCAGDANLAARVRALLGGVEQVEARHVVITEDRQRAWHRLVDGEGGSVGRYLLALVLTGCRANELRKLPAAGWDADAGVIHISTTKNGKAHALPVGLVLRALIGAEVGATPEGGALFDVPVKTYRASVERIGQGIGLDWHLHDLRRTFATCATRAGVEEGVLKALMNHSTSGNVTARHYVQRDIEDLRPAMQAIEDHFLKLWGVAP
jgi:integrase